MSNQISNDTLSIYFLAVNDADSIVLELPFNKVKGKREYIIIDSGVGGKTTQCLEYLDAKIIRLMVLTHPHSDHYIGLESVLRFCEQKNIEVQEFWDSGFRSNKQSWIDLITVLESKDDIRFSTPSSGFTTTYGDVTITVLAPSIYLKNRYDTYGVDRNNASIVLKVEYDKHTIILAGDAEWDSWAKITEEFPYFKKNENPDSMIKVEEGFNPIKCDVLKVAHHGSKHGTSLQAIERLHPKYAVISCGALDTGKFSFPDNLTIDILNDNYEKRDTKIITTCDNGTIVMRFTPGKRDIDVEPVGFIEYQY